MENESKTPMPVDAKGELLVLEEKLQMEIQEGREAIEVLDLISKFIIDEELTTKEKKDVDLEEVLRKASETLTRHVMINNIAVTRWRLKIIKLATEKSKKGE